MCVATNTFSKSDCNFSVSNCTYFLLYFECLCNGQSWIPAAAIIMDWIKLRSFLNSHTTKTCYNLIITWCSSIKSLFRTTSSTLHLLILVPMQTCQTIIIKKNEMRHPKEQRPRRESKRLIFSKSVEITEQQKAAQRHEKPFLLSRCAPFFT